MSKNPGNPNLKKVKTPMKSQRQILLDLASTLQGSMSDSTATSGAESGPGSIDLFSEVNPEASTVPNSTSPSEEDDNSVADKH